MKASSHNPDSLGVRFDASGLIANAGLILPATLARRLGAKELIDQHVRLPEGEGAANAGEKAMSVVASLIAGGEWIDDVNGLRSGKTEALLGHRVASASSVGIFLRAFTAGHARQLDMVIDDLLARAWIAGARPDDEVTRVDVDSSLVETYGLKKQGGNRFTYQHTRGYHPLLAVIAGSGEVLHARLRGGSSHAGRGAGSFVRQALARLRSCARAKLVILRGDSGFYSAKTVDACYAHDARFSISVRLQAGLHKIIAALPESAWTDIPYWREGTAAVAETSYRPFGRQRECRLIVRRVYDMVGGQFNLPGLGYRYHAFITDRDGEMLELEADHRRHAEVENVIRDLKHGLGLNHLPSGTYGANAAWLALNVIAHNLCRWLTRLAGLTVLHLKALRTRLFALPARLVRSGRRAELRFPLGWRWEDLFLRTLDAARALAPATSA